MISIVACCHSVKLCAHAARLSDCNSDDNYFPTRLSPLTTAIGLPFFGHKSSSARAKELFKPFTDSASLLVDVEKKRFLFSVGVLR